MSLRTLMVTGILATPVVVLMTLSRGLLPWATLLFGIITLVLYLSRQNTTLRSVLVLALLIRVFLVAVHVFVTDLPNSGADAQWIDSQAVAMARSGAVDLDVIRPGVRLYIWGVALIYYVFGHDLLLPLTLNATFGTLTVFNVYRTVRLVSESQRHAVIASLVVAFHPMMSLYSAILLREASIAWLVSSGTYYAVRWSKSGRTISLAKALGALGMAVGLHSGVIGAFVAFVWEPVRGWLKALSDSRRRIPLRAVVASPIILAAVAVILVSGWGLADIGDPTDQNALIDEIARKQVGRESARTQYLQNLIVRSPIDIIWQLPIRIVYFLLSPFPWMVRNVADVLGFLVALVTLWLLFRVWQNRRHLLGKTSTQLVFAAWLGLVAIYSMGTSNYGTAHRHATKFFPLLVVLAWSMPSRSASWHAEEAIRENGESGVVSTNS